MRKLMRKLIRELMRKLEKKINEVEKDLMELRYISEKKEDR